MKWINTCGVSFLRRRSFIIACALVLFSGCDSEKNESSEIEAPTLGQEVSCSAVPVREPGHCNVISVDGFTYRYSFIAPQEPSKQVILVEYGGPGISSMAEQGLSPIVKQIEGSGLAGYGILLLEEPWVTASVSEACWKSVNEFGKWLRNPTDTGPELSDTCFKKHVFGWTPALYRNVIDAIVAQQGVKIAGYIGYSFGGIRLSYLAGLALDWAILVNPVLPNMDLEDLLKHQAKGVNSLLDSWRRESNQFAGILGTQPESRSLPVTITDVLAGAYALQPSIPEGISTKLPSGREMGMLSDAYTGRFGQFSISLGKLAYWQEFCSTVPTANRPKKWNGTLEDALGFAEAIHSPCTSLARVPVKMYIPQRTCIIQSAKDRIIPYSVTEKLFAANKAVDFIALEDGQHDLINVINPCLAKAGFNQKASHNIQTLKEHKSGISF